MPQEKKDNSMTIAIISLVGTLIAALISSPFLFALFEKNQATPTPPAVVTTQVPAGVTTEPTIGTNQVLTFQENFDNDNVSGFAYEGSGWQVVKEKSNQVLQGTADGSMIKAIFGPSDFTNGVIEFRIEVEQFALGQNASINFRTSNQSAYSLAFQENQVTLGYHEAGGSSIVPFSSDTTRSLVFKQGVWYLIHIEVRGSQIEVFIDNNRLLGANDSRLQKGGLNFSLGPGYQVKFDDVKVWEYQ